MSRKAVCRPGQVQRPCSALAAGAAPKRSASPFSAWMPTPFNGMDAAYNQLVGRRPAATPWLATHTVECPLFALVMSSKLVGHDHSPPAYRKPLKAPFVDVGL
jgi:hypothetical protein